MMLRIKFRDYGQVNFASTLTGDPTVLRPDPDRIDALRVSKVDFKQAQATDRAIGRMRD